MFARKTLLRQAGCYGWLASTRDTHNDQRSSLLLLLLVRQRQLVAPVDTVSARPAGCLAAPFRMNLDNLTFLSRYVVTKKTVNGARTLFPKEATTTGVVYPSMDRGSNFQVTPWVIVGTSHVARTLERSSFCPLRRGNCVCLLLLERVSDL